MLINDAGVLPFRHLGTQLRRVEAYPGINLDSQSLMAKAVMGSMRQNSWGRIVNLASNSLGLAVLNMVPYMAAKAGVVGFTGRWPRI